MGELFRSEEMSSVQLFVQIDAVHATVDELGQLGVVQFRDVSHFISLSSNLPFSETENLNLIICIRS
jgi:vacuolar-type H+-ATPase subunit I/STV1